MATVDLGEMNIDHVEAINNADTIFLVAYIDLGLQQFSRCPSATSAEVQQPDLDIMNGWIDVFEQNFEHFAAQPQLYMPKAHPKPKNLPTPPVVKIVQNPNIQHQMYELSHMRTDTSVQRRCRTPQWIPQQDGRSCNSSLGRQVQGIQCSTRNEY